MQYSQRKAPPLCFHSFFLHMRMNIHQNIFLLFFLLFGFSIEIAQAQSGPSTLRVLAISENLPTILFLITYSK